MGLGPVQLAIIGSLLRPGMRILTIGRLKARDDLGHEKWFDDWVAERTDVTTFSLDVSGRDGATVIADLNEEDPLESSLKESFDLLIDGGSLEHVANTQSALRNYHHLLKVGGTIFLCNPSNGYAGHGLYQFSPEFYYRAFSRDNGFEPILGLLEARSTTPFRRLGYKSRIFLSPDPARFGRRLGFKGGQKTQMLFLAQRNELGPPTFTFVQSDYEDLLEDTPKPDSSRASHEIRRALATQLKKLRKRLLPTLYPRMRKFLQSELLFRLGAHPLERVSAKEFGHIIGTLGDREKSA